jgi:hypothetical protein
VKKPNHSILQKRRRRLSQVSHLKRSGRTSFASSVTIKVTNKENVQRMNQLKKEPPKTVNLVRVLVKFYQTKMKEEKLESKPEKLEKLSFRSKELRKKLLGKPKLLQEMISFQSLLRLLIALHSHRLISILPSQSQPLELGNSENLICKNKKTRG